MKNSFYNYKKFNPYQKIYDIGRCRHEKIMNASLLLDIILYKINKISLFKLSMKWSIEDFVYGSTDGAITTFAIVAGAFGASLSTSVILILGFANLFADGFSMSIGNYLSTKTQKEFIEKERKREESKIENNKTEAEHVLRDIYKNKGFKGQLLDEIVHIITIRKKIWLDTVMKEKLGMSGTNRKPLDSAITTFVSFNVIGLIPLLPFLFSHVFVINFVQTNNVFLFSIISTGVSFFLIGIIKGRIVNKSLIKSGIHTLLIGAIAAFVAFIVGYFLSFYVE